MALREDSQPWDNSKDEVEGKELFNFNAQRWSGLNINRSVFAKCSVLKWLDWKGKWWWFGSPGVVSEENKGAKDDKSKSGEEEEQQRIAP